MDQVSNDFYASNGSPPAFIYNPEGYEDKPTLHWCLPGNNHDERTFNAREYESGKLHLVDFDYIEEPLLPHTTNERYNSATAARASRRIKQGHASECPFCTDKEFTYHHSRLGSDHNYDRREDAEILVDFKKTIIESCRPERESGPRTISPDINYSEITKPHIGAPKLEILTNTSQIRTAYPRVAALPNWYSLGYAIAQNPWVEVEEHNRLETDHTLVLISAKRPNPDNYGRDYFRLLSQRDDIPYETKTSRE